MVNLNNKLRKEKREILSKPVEHIDITSFDSTSIIDAYRKMSFTARDTAKATDIYCKMLENPECTIFLTLTGSTSAAGCMKIYSDLIENSMIDVVVATGASIVDMDFFEALGFRHYQGISNVNDKKLRNLYIDRIYNTFIDEEELQDCDRTIKKIADNLEPRPYSSREFIKEMGNYLIENSKKKDSLVETAYKNNVPVFCPAFSDSSAGFGLVVNQKEKKKNFSKYLTIDSVADFRELTDIKIKSKTTGLFMIGGGVPKNFAQDTVICAEILGRDVPMHKYVVQITVADARDGACSSSTLREAQSWGKVDVSFEQMVYAEATSILPLIVSYAYHKKNWKIKRKKRELNKMFK